jgi:hypothetical protein
MCWIFYWCALHGIGKNVPIWTVYWEIHKAKMHVIENLVLQGGAISVGQWLKVGK